MISTFEGFLLILLTYGMPLTFIFSLIIAYLYLEKYNSTNSYKKKIFSAIGALGVALIITSILTSILLFIIF